jgi:hypothetical protein
MAVLQVLPEMVCAVELLARVTLPKLVHFLQMPQSVVPVLVGGLAGTPGTTAARKLVSAVPTSISFAWPVSALVEGLVVAGEVERRARPAVAPDVQAILVPLCLVLVLEPAMAECAFVLLFCLMGAA